MRKSVWIVLGALLGVIVLAGLFVGSALYTDRSEFCRTCHEMTPHSDAWAQGPHKEVPCIECHVESGLPARFAHKFVALGEVYSHFTGDTSFPRQTPPNIPNERCVKCHKDLPPKLDNGFPHDLHAEKGTCAQCHFDTGHAVSDQALKDAGVFNADVVPQRLNTQLVRVGAGSANLPGHPTVLCSKCHDMKATPCSSCHQHPADDHIDTKGKDCSNCHAAAAKFAFSHPSAGEHNWRSRPCVKCHPVSVDQVYCTCHKGNPPND
jgi:hypothetical protein